MNKKKLAAIAVIPALGVVALAGSVFAANSTSTSSTASAISSIAQHFKGMRGGMKGGTTAYTADLASVLGLTQADIQAKLAAGQTLTSIITGAGKTQADVMTQLKTLRLASMKSKLSTQVASGKITQAQADAMLAKASTETGNPMMGGFGGHGPKDKTMMAQDLASILGLTQADVQAKLDAGQTPNSIITGAGKTMADVMAQMKALRLANEKTKLAADVASGKITHAQADARLAREATETPGAHHGNRSNDGDADDAASTTPSSSTQ